MKAAVEYRERVIQLESLIARIAMVVVLPPKTSDLVDYVTRTSIAMTEDYDPDAKISRGTQVVTPLEDLVAALNESEDPK